MPTKQHSQDITCIQENNKMVIRHGSEIIVIVEDNPNIRIKQDHKADPIIVESISDEIDDELLGSRIEKAKTEKHYTTEEAREYLGL